MTRALMGLIKDRHGTYCAQQKVPARLQAAVAQVLDNGKPRQAYLKKSLGTKDLKAANVRAKPVLAGFDRVLGEAEQLLAARPMRRALAPSKSNVWPKSTTRSCWIETKPRAAKAQVQSPAFSRLLHSSRLRAYASDQSENGSVHR